MKRINIARFLKEQGYELFEDVDYSSFLTNEKVPFKDKEGYKYALNRSCLRFKDDKFNPIRVCPDNPYSIENIKRYIELNDLPITLLGKDYKDSSGKLEFIGECGHKYTTSWRGVKNNAQYCCPKCMNVNNGLKERLGSKYIIDYFKKKGLEVISPRENILVTTKLLCRDKDGYLGEINYNNLNFNKMFYPFSKYNPYTYDNIRTYLRKNNIDTELISTEPFVSNKSLLKWKCGCGTIFERNFDSVHFKNSIKCVKCAKKIAGEKQKITKSNRYKY